MPTPFNIALLISPEAKSAYFKDYLNVAEQELLHVFPEKVFCLEKIGTLEFFQMYADETEWPRLVRLSFAQGIFLIENQQLRPLDIGHHFLLHEDFVFGSKFRGKTNERLTQLLINIGLSTIGENIDSNKRIKLLDPMCGRATTLLWAMRYGIDAKGIEQDNKALADIRQNLKKWTKLHKQKHKLQEGFTAKANKQDKGKFLEFSVQEHHMKVVVGDARHSVDLLKSEKFDLIISDLPYGVQHFTDHNTRNPLPVIEACIPQWDQHLKDQGAIVLAFNSYIPKRDKIIDAFEGFGLTVTDFCAPHRMSESIVRDVIVVTKT